MWLLIIIHLSLHPPQDWPEGKPWEPHVYHAEISQEFFQSEQKCIEKTQEVFREADLAGNPVPPEINMGCVPLNKQET